MKEEYNKCQLCKANALVFPDFYKNNIRIFCDECRYYQTQIDEYRPRIYHRIIIRVFSELGITVTFGFEKFIAINLLLAIIYSCIAYSIKSTLFYYKEIINFIDENNIIRYMINLLNWLDWLVNVWAHEEISL
ncbi:hypothetical protein TCON_2009 [Astathelohania contejeani]|uniref:Uncharacterized protein n=1 Tax=Astathelohania contejeani TaxID=164912 RepID=A0ABQ7HX73_9MICR|nr:hypothetical protein TCON_2009 [Thelohania contejeani]